jgi:integrase
LPVDSVWINTKTEELLIRDRHSKEIGWRKVSEIVFWDEDLPGFGLRVRPKSQTFIVQGRDQEQRHVKVKLGAYSQFFPPEAAKRKAKEELGKLAAGLNPNAVRRQEEVKGLTLRQLFEVYKADRKLRSTTVIVYESALNRCFSKWLDRPALEITGAMVVERYKELEQHRGPKSAEGGMKSQANQAMRVLRALLNHAAGEFEEAGVVAPPNPVKLLSKRGIKWNKLKRRKDIIDPHKMRAWYQALCSLDKRADTTRDYILLCLFTGLRRTECATLTWDRVDLEGRKLIIDPDHAKTDEEHGLPLPDVVYKILVRRSKLRCCGDEYVFPSRDKSDSKSHITEPKSVMNTIGERINQKVGMHTLRRTFATTAQDLGIPYLTLKRLLSHKVSGDVTAGYTNLTLNMLREPMQRIADHLSELMGVGDTLDIDASGKLLKGTNYEIGQSDNLKVSLKLDCGHTVVRYKHSLKAKYITRVRCDECADQIKSAASSRGRELTHK